MIDMLAESRLSALRGATYPDRVAASLPDRIPSAALNPTERRAVARIVELLEAELGEDLLAVWLYGSRAREEADSNETDPDLRSDIDLIAIIEPLDSSTELSWRLQPQLEKIVDREGDSPVYYSLRIFDARWLRGRRQINSFFTQEVDRDKIVLAGGRLEGKEYR